MSKYKRRNKSRYSADAPSSLEDVPHTDIDDKDKAVKDYILKALRSGFKELKPDKADAK
jgi:hypothetical protein